MTQRDNSWLVCTTLVVSVAYATLHVVLWGMAPNYGFDENWHTVFATLTPAWRAFLTMSDDPHPFLYYLLLRPLLHFGSDPIFPRLLSIVPTLLTIPLWYHLLRKFRVSTGVAVVATLVLATSYPFLDMSVMVRSYSLTVFLLLAALWFWVDMLPGNTGRPSRWSAVASLSLFGIAFLCLYAAGFVTTAIITATLLTLLANKPLRAQILDAWRRHGGWPEWLLFFFLHLVGVAWFILGIRNAGDAQVPGHVQDLVIADGQGIGDFLATGLRQELNLFLSLPTDALWIVDIAWPMILILAIGLFMRSLHRGNAVAAVIAITPILLTGILAVLGLVRHYPFGGELRHQYVLFPFLLLLLTLALDVVWRHIGSLIARGLLGTLLVALALSLSFKTLSLRTTMGEALAEPWWGDEFNLLFGTDTDVPVIIPQYIYYSAFMNRWVPGIRYQNSYNCGDQGCSSPTQGWRALIEPRPAIQEYATHTNSGKPLTLLTYYRWLFPDIPDAALFTQIIESLQTVGAQGGRIFSPGSSTDRNTLSAAVAAQGFTLTEFLVTDNGLIWSIMETPHSSDGQTGTP
jgi:hypothetical protein